MTDRWHNQPLRNSWERKTVPVCWLSSTRISMEPHA